MELLKNKKDIFYDDKIDIICGDTGYIMSPFGSIDSIIEIAKKSNLSNIRELAFITLDTEGKFTLHGKEIAIRNLINFALDE